jgi:hypothetical protein
VFQQPFDFLTFFQVVSRGQSKDIGQRRARIKACLYLKASIYIDLYFIMNTQPLISTLANHGPPSKFASPRHPLQKGKKEQLVGNRAMHLF